VLVIMELYNMCVAVVCLIVLLAVDAARPVMAAEGGSTVLPLTTNSSPVANLTLRQCIHRVRRTLIIVRFFKGSAALAAVCGLRVFLVNCFNNLGSKGTEVKKLILNEKQTIITDADDAIMFHHFRVSDSARLSITSWRCM